MEVSSRSIFSGSEKYLSDAFCEDVTVWCIFKVNKKYLFEASFKINMRIRII
jgi:hypothetical protein